MSKYRRLTRSDRYQIERLLAAGKSKSQVADSLGFHRSSVYREFNRGKIRKGVPGGKKPGEYSALEAHRRFKSTFHDARVGCFYRGAKIKGWVEDQICLKLSEGWSPEQISNRLRIEKNISISTEGIYKFILSGKKRGWELYKYLRHYRRRRRRFKRRNRYWEMQYQRRKSIDDRPVEANRRAEDGHWERDLMLGKRNTGAVLTMVDRKSHYTLLQKLRTTLASEVNDKTSRGIKKSGLKYLTMTNDNGHEFGEFWNLEDSLKIPVYFTHALCPWERGTVENTIGLLRQFVPKGTDLNNLTAQDLKELEKTINSRPRKSLGYKTPYENKTGRSQKLIKKKRIEEPAPEYYEQYYLTPEEIEEKKIFRGETVALSG
jgi:transposase, IS30 family